MIRRAIRFLSEVRAELGKATWPWDPKEKGVKRYRELIDSTTVVVIAMLLLSGYIAFWDYIWGSAVSLLVH